MKTKLLGTMIALFLVGVAWAGKGRLDGKTYKVMISDAEKKGFADTLIFKNGTFDSTECQKYGFKPTSYVGDGASFSAMAKSEKEGTAQWSGTIKGDAIEGKMVWTKTGEGPRTYTFSGSAQK